MKTPRPCSARSLHKVSLRIGDKSYHEASAFPYFDATGKVRRFMLILPRSHEIFELEARPGALTRHWWGLRVAEGHEPRPLNRAGKLGALWHYDPWWILAKKRFDDHPAKAALKATNMVDRLHSSAVDLLYNQTLTQVVAQRQFSWRFSWFRLFPFDTELLPAASQPTAQLADKTSWRLAPRWSVEGWPRQNRRYERRPET